LSLLERESIGDVTFLAPATKYAGAKMIDALACNPVSFASPFLRELT
jgi:hypothetical protein